MGCDWRGYHQNRLPGWGSRYLWLPAQALITFSLLLCSSRFRAWLMTVWIMGLLVLSSSSFEPAPTGILAATIHCFLASLTSHDTFSTKRATVSRLVKSVDMNFLPTRAAQGKSDDDEYGSINGSIFSSSQEVVLSISGQFFVRLIQKQSAL